MSAPTIYFPDVPYQLGSFAPVRVWATRVAEGPSGRRQSSIMWTRPKRRFRAILLGVDGTTTYSAVTFKTIRKFLTQLKGRYRNFYIFDVAPHDYDQEEPEAFVGIFDTSFPMVTPFRNGTIANIYVNGVLHAGPGQFTQDSLGTGGEVRIATTSVPLPSDGDEISVDITGAEQRIPAVSLTDVDEFTYDTTAAIPPAEYHLDCEEDFG